MKRGLIFLSVAVCVGAAVAKDIWLTAEGREDSASSFKRILRSVRGPEPCAIHLADGEYHFYSSSATNMRFHVSNHDQPEIRPVFLPFIGVTNVSVVAKNAKFVMHGMGTAILVQDSLGVSFKGITVEWEKPFFAKAEIVGFEDGKTRVRFPTRDKVVVEDGKLMLCGEDWKVNLRDGNVFRWETHEMVERTADVIFSGKGAACSNGDFLVDVDLSKVGAGAKVGDVYVMRNGYRPHPIVCLDRAKDTVFEDFVFRDGFGMGILAQLSENVTLRGGGCYPRDRNEYNSNTIDATHFSNCRGTMTVENCRFEGMMDDALNVHSTCLGIVAKPAADTIRCRYMHHQAVGFGVFSAGDAVRFIAGRTLENGFVGKVKTVVTHDEREITLVLEKPIPPEYGVGDAVENADWQCAVVFRNNTVANNRARGVLFTTPKKIVCEGNFFDHVSGSAILLAGDAQGWYESGSCEDLVIRKNRFRDCLTSVFQYCDALISMHPEVKDLRAQKRRYHRNVLIEDNEIETFDVPLLYTLSAENVTWRNNHVIRNDRYRSWGRKPFEVIGGENVVIDEVSYAATWNGRALDLNLARISSVPFCRVWPGRQREISQTEMSHFVRFDLSASGEFIVRGPGVAKRLKRLLPLSAAEILRKKGEDTLDLSIAKPGAYVLEFDGLPTLHVFADPPLPPIPVPGPGGKVIRFAKGEHHPGVVAPKSGDVVVLDEGAVVYGSLFILNATNVTVTGRGIFDGSRLERSDEVMRKFRREHGLPEIDTESACFAYSVYGSENVTISGVTFRDPPFWTLVVRNQCRNTLIDNIHVVGNWRYNSDGIDVCASADTVIRNSFLRTFDDCVIARGPYMKGEFAPVSGMVVTNCALYCDWGVPFKAQVQDFHGSTIENVTMRDCKILAMRENAIFLAVRYGSDLDILRSLTFEDLEFSFFPQPRSGFQSRDGETFVAQPLTENCLALAYSYTLGKNLDNQVNAPMENPDHYRFIFENFAFRRFKALGEKRAFCVRLESLVPRHEIRGVNIVDLPEHKLVTKGDVQY